MKDAKNRAHFIDSQMVTGFFNLFVQAIPGINAVGETDVVHRQSLIDKIRQPIEVPGRNGDI
jgi:hypothetical protein